MKKCYKCGIVQELSCFQKDKYRKDGLQSKCKTCTKARNAIYHAEHRAYFVEHGRRRYRKATEADPEFNAKRYEANKEQFLEGRKRQSRSPRGRLLNLLSAALRRSRERWGESDLTKEWLLELYDSQGGCCAMTGLPFKFELTREGEKFTPFSPSLDRADCSKGYMKDNVRLVCTAVNLGLNTWGEEVYEEVATAFLEKRGYSVSKKAVTPVTLQSAESEPKP